jgi:hypothetical protein
MNLDGFGGVTPKIVKSKRPSKIDSPEMPLVDQNAPKPSYYQLLENGTYAVIASDYIAANGALPEVQVDKMTDSNSILKGSISEIQ